MINALLLRLRQGKHTIKFPAGAAPALPERFAGLPVLSDRACPPDCSFCLDACPADALHRDPATGELRLDLGRCLFCRRCEAACPADSITFAKDYRLAAARREDLILGPATTFPAPVDLPDVRRLFGRSLKLRQVCAGGCGACEADTNVLNTIGWDLGRFGIEFVASPRHADGLLVTGPVTRNMEKALLETYEAVPAPRLVIATGCCAVGGGPCHDLGEIAGPVDRILPVDLFIPGCPPHPLTILEGLLRLTGRIKG